MDDIIEEAKSLVSMGIKELIVIGQDTTAYGVDIYGEYKLHTLLSRLAKETDVKWLRILYCYPDKITPELINELKTNEKLVKYIDIPVQHISSSVLKRMNRKGDGNLVREVMKSLREIDGIAIRSTAIVGFPGESEDDFTELCEFIREVKFERFGAFTYSREEDTPAYGFDDQIDEQIKQDRYDIIMREQLPISEKQGQECLGKQILVLTEGYDVVAETYYGRSYKDAPDIDGKVFFTSKKKHSIGDFVNVKITEAYDYDLSGVEI
jgi:ribosomal protein S12 methylthiotransferase